MLTALVSYDAGGLCSFITASLERYSNAPQTSSQPRDSASLSGDSAGFDADGSHAVSPASPLSHTLHGRMGSSSGSGFGDNDGDSTDTPHCLVDVTVTPMVPERDDGDNGDYAGAVRFSASPLSSDAVSQGATSADGAAPDPPQQEKQRPRGTDNVAIGTSSVTGQCCPLDTM